MAYDAALQDDFQLPEKETKQKRSPNAKLEEKKVPSNDETPETPAEEKKSEYAKEELLHIFDEIIFQGEYSEEVVVNNKLRLGFRTRSCGEIEEINRVVDSSKANLMTTLNDTRTLLNLQYALTQYHTKDLRSYSIEDKAKFLKTIPGPVIAAMLTALQKFDQKVFVACQEGEENF